MNIRLGHTKKPMSAKQKAALAKAIAASAAKRRGTGKSDALSKKPGRFTAALEKRRADLKSASKSDPTVKQKTSYSPKSAWNKASMKARADMAKQPYGGNAASRIPRNDGVSRPGSWRRKPKTQGGSNSRDANLKRYSDANRRIDEKLAALKKSSAKSSKKNTEAMRDSRMAQKPKPHPLETAAGTKPYMLKKQIDQAKPGSVRNQLIAELNRLRKSYWAGNQEIKPEKPSSTTGSGSNKPAMGTKDPGEMGVSQILAERKHLIAKQNSEGLTKDEEARLKLIRAESALRHQNRKAGKGTGPTKVSMAKKEPAKKTDSSSNDLSKRSRMSLDKSLRDKNAPESLKQKIREEIARREGKSSGNNISDPDGKKREQRRKEMGYGDSADKPKKEILSSKGVEREWDSVYNVYAKIHNTGRAAKITVGKDGKIEIDFSNTNMAGNTLRPTSIMNALEKAGYRNTRLEGDKILAEVASSGDDSGPNVRNPFKGGNSIPKDVKGREINDDTDLTDLPDKDFNKIDDIRMEMSDVALDTLMRDNLVEEIDNAETIGQMMDAMQGLYLYLDEWDDLGRNTSEIRRKMDPLFEDLKKYSDRWPRS